MIKELLKLLRIPISFKAAPVVRTILSNTFSSDNIQHDSCLYGFTRCAQLCETDNMQLIWCYLLRDIRKSRRLYDGLIYSRVLINRSS